MRTTCCHLVHIAVTEVLWIAPEGLALSTCIFVGAFLFRTHKVMLAMFRRVELPVQSSDHPKSRDGSEAAVCDEWNCCHCFLLIDCSNLEIEMTGQWTIGDETLC
ncbi:hypothetical protein BD289DRAFT_444887 [Coniella lustricola]|uniref:Uncharacterized protein n=1 Tax=Coniella lustricola TaxID=2025994 RepID=A0A2T2ZVH5_9PEZI|nr:hypothetical protein BD289DRAFT_444887 [Coniella lustricola]